MTRTVTVYTRAGCHLCVEAVELASRVAGDVGVRFHSEDVDGDPELRAEYGDRVPVVMVGHREVGHFQISEAALRSALQKA